MAREESTVAELFRNREPVRTEGYITDVFTDEAIRFVEEVHAGQPFLLYFATNAPHDPFQVPREYLDRYADLPAKAAPNRDNGNPRKLSDYEQARYVYAMMTNLDDNLRRLAERLRELGEWENTVVVFLSDNGPAGFRFNAGLRDKKGTVCSYETAS
jgi:arylsulfatase